jgi:small-conductance mechanosensitive channel
MSELENALDRLGDAVANLITASDQGRAAGGAETSATAQIAVLTNERDRLQGEIDELRALREDDAQLHAEAAEAVKLALRDLRSLAAIQEKAGQE